MDKDGPPNYDRLRIILVTYNCQIRNAASPKVYQVLTLFQLSSMVPL